MSLLPSPRHWPRSAWLLIAANAVPLWGVLAWGWPADALLWLYWMENLVVGVFAALRVVCARGGSPPGVGAGFMAPFFVVHFGLFCLVHGIFLSFILDPGTADPLGDVLAFDGIFDTVAGAIWAILALSLSHGYSFAVDYLRGGEFRRALPQAEMLRPYPRILVMQLTVLAGGALMLMLQAPVAALAILILVKTALDLTGLLRERARSGVAAPTSEPAPD